MTKSRVKKTKYTLYGPARDVEFVCWIVYGPNGGDKGTFYTKKEAQEWIRRNRR